ncbi:hypothetical protein CK203_004250 [Vitis vinifera]|uniref:Uncharacterized protein n=1 Tax=Vitis vinifera TaxID=29760 RepID=A0A438KAG7_VITVI|nr:hypothetical protein CK203_004250 [Vitis vinifera]
MAFSTLQKMLSLVSLLLLVMLICSDHVSSHSNEETQALLTNSSTHLGTATSPCKWYGILQPCRECHQNKPHRVHQCVKVRLPPMCNSERYQSVVKGRIDSHLRVTLSNLSVYRKSSFVMPWKMGRRLEKYQKDFLWVNRKLHLGYRLTMCKDKRTEGLNIRDLMF